MARDVKARSELRRPVKATLKRGDFVQGLFGAVRRKPFADACLIDEEGRWRCASTAWQ
jgi:hypothetical protein